MVLANMLPPIVINYFIIGSGLLAFCVNHLPFHHNYLGIILLDFWQDTVCVECHNIVVCV